MIAGQRVLDADQVLRVNLLAGIELLVERRELGHDIGLVVHTVALRNVLVETGLEIPATNPGRCQRIQRQPLDGVVHRHIEREQDRQGRAEAVAGDRQAARARALRDEFAHVDGLPVRQYAAQRPIDAEEAVFDVAGLGHRTEPRGPEFRIDQPFNQVLRAADGHHVIKGTFLRLRHEAEELALRLAQDLIDGGQIQDEFKRWGENRRQHRRSQAPRTGPEHLVGVLDEHAQRIGLRRIVDLNRHRGVLRLNHLDNATPSRVPARLSGMSSL